MNTLTKVYLFIGAFLFLHAVEANAQNASLIINSGTYYVGGNNSFSVLAGNIQTDGNINSSPSNTFSFIGNTQQRIVCVAGGGCADVFNVNAYNTIFGNVDQNNAAGTSIETNVRVLGVHTFNNGSTELKEGNYWLSNTSSTPFSNNDGVNKFFVTTGHGLLKRSDIGLPVLFPIGTAANSNNYTPLFISYGGTNDNFSARVLDNVHYRYENMINGDPVGPTVYNSSTSFVRKTWIVNKETPVTDYSDGFLAKLQWNAINEDATFNHNTMGVNRNHDGVWFSENALSAATGTGPYQYDAIKVITYDNDFYPYYPITVSSIISTLAVKGFKLTATLGSTNAVTLNWSTVTEVNSNYFVVEKSFDGSSYSPVANVNAAGNSNALKQYALVDNNINVDNDLIYYRIREVGINGTSDFSNVAAVKLKNDAGSLITIYPNPAIQHIGVHFKNAAGNYIVRVIDNSGRTLISQNVIITHSIDRIAIGRNGLPSGAYFVSITNKSTGVSQTILVNIL